MLLSLFNLPTVVLILRCLCGLQRPKPMPPCEPCSSSTRAGSTSSGFPHVTPVVAPLPCFAGDHSREDLLRAMTRQGLHRPLQPRLAPTLARSSKSGSSPTRSSQSRPFPRRIRPISPRPAVCCLLCIAPVRHSPASACEEDDQRQVPAPRSRPCLQVVALSPDTKRPPRRAPA